MLKLIKVVSYLVTLIELVYSSVNHRIFSASIELRKRKRTISIERIF